MPDFSVSSLEYGELFTKLLSKRLKVRGERFLVKGSSVLTDRSPAAAGAISDALLRDVKPLELARLTSLLPVSLREKRAVLPRALELTGSEKHSAYVLERVFDYIGTEKKLIAEGFLRFRLPLVIEDWALAVDRAGEELLLRNEYMELVGAFRTEDGSGENPLTVVLDFSGEAVIRDERGLYIEAPRTDGMSLVPLLLSLAPSSLTVYDLTGGRERELLLGIRAVFGERVKFYITR